MIPVTGIKLGELSPETNQGTLQRPPKMKPQFGIIKELHMNTSIVNPATDNNSTATVITSIHEKKSCEVTISQSSIEYLHQLSWQLKELNSFLDSGVNLPTATIEQLKDQRTELIDKLEFCLSSLPSVSESLASNC